MRKRGKPMGIFLNKARRNIKTRNRIDISDLSKELGNPGVSPEKRKHKIALPRRCKSFFSFGNGIAIGDDSFPDQFGENRMHRFTRNNPLRRGKINLKFVYSIVATIIPLRIL